MKNIFLVMVVLAVLTAMTVSAAQFGADAPLVSLNGNEITITGTAIDAEGAIVQLKCGDNIVAQSTVADGEYKLLTLFGGINGCGSGEYATIKMGDAETTVFLQKQGWAVTETGGSKENKELSTPFYEFTSGSTIIPGVPEFPLFTLGLAIVVVGLGIAFMRKD